MSKRIKTPAIYKRLKRSLTEYRVDELVVMGILYDYMTWILGFDKILCLIGVAYPCYMTFLALTVSKKRSDVK